MALDRIGDSHGAERGKEAGVRVGDDRLAGGLLQVLDGLRSLPVAEQTALRARRTSHSAEGLASALRCLGQGAQPDYWPSLVKILRPTLVLSGGLDPKYTRIARKMVIDLPLGWRRSFRGVGHAPHLECPTEYAQELTAFLAPAWRGEPAEHAP